MKKSIYVLILLLSLFSIPFMSCEKEPEENEPEEVVIPDPIDTTLTTLYHKQYNGDSHGTGTECMTFKISTGMAGTPGAYGDWVFTEAGYFLSFDLNTSSGTALPTPGTYTISNTGADFTADCGYYYSAGSYGWCSGTCFVEVDETGDESVRFIKSGAIEVEDLTGGNYRITANLTAKDDGVITAVYEGGLLSENDIANSMFEIRTGPSDGSVAGLKYYVYSPVEDEFDTEQYPVLFWLHGLGQGGGSLYAPLNGSDVKNFVSSAYQAFMDEGGFYLVVPQNPEGSAGYSMGWMTGDGTTGKSLFVGVLNNVIDEVLANDQINTDKVYVAGFSAGGLMTWHIGLNRPEDFAAVVPICPAYRPTDAELGTLVNNSIWIIHGVQDPACNFSIFTKGVKEKLEELGSTTVRLSALDPVLNPDKTVAESQHHAWVPVTYNMMYNDDTRYDPNYEGTFLDWLNACSNE